MEVMEICSDVSDVLDLLLENIVIGANQPNLFGKISEPGKLPSGARRKFLDIGIPDEYFIAKRVIEGDIRTTVVQCTVHKQTKKSVNCGYHAIHNSLSILNLLTQDDGNVQQTIMGFLNTPFVPYEDTYAMTANGHVPSGYPTLPKHFHTTCGPYQESFANTRKELYKIHNLAKESSNHLYPWDEPTIESGVLERAHLQQLILSHERMALISSRLGKRSNEIFFNIPELCREHVVPLHQIFSQENYVIAFLVGNVNHWNTIVVHRNGNEVEIILADSHNRDLLFIDETKVQTYYSTSASQVAPNSPHADGDAQEVDPIQRFMNWSNMHKMLQCKANVDMFIKCANQSTTIQTIFCDANVQLVLKSLVENAMKEGNFTQESLQTWMREYWPITVLRKTHLDRLRKVGWRYISEQLRKQYEDTIKRILLVQVTDDLINLQGVFSDILAELQRKANL